MVAIEPEHRVRQEEVGHFPASVIIDQGAPVLMLSQPRVGMLVEMRAIEIDEPMGIAGEMSGHPVEQDANPLAVATVDEMAEILRRSHAARRRIERDRLIAPGAVERMLADGDQSKMSEPHVPDIGHKTVGKLALAQKTGPH